MCTFVTSEMVAFQRPKAVDDKFAKPTGFPSDKNEKT